MIRYLNTNTYHVDEKESFLLSKDELLARFEIASKYLSKEAREYLELLLKNKISVFNNIEFMELFCSYDLFYEIAKLNIVTRTIYLIKNCEWLDQNRIKIHILKQSGNFYILYTIKNCEYKIFDSNFINYKYEGREKKSSIILDEYRLTVDESIRKINDKINLLYERLNGNILSNQEAVRRLDLDERIARGETIAQINKLQEKLERLEHLDKRHEEILNIVNELLLEDWDISLDRVTTINGLRCTKSLSWIEIKKNLI